MFEIYKLHSLEQKIELKDINTLGVTADSGDNLIVTNSLLSVNQSSVVWIKGKHKIQSLSISLSSSTLKF